MKTAHLFILYLIHKYGYKGKEDFDEREMSISFVGIFPYFPLGALTVEIFRVGIPSIYQNLPTTRIPPVIHQYN